MPSGGHLAQQGGQQVVGFTSRQGIEGHANRDRLIRRRWPIGRRLSSEGGDQQERTVDERASQPMQQVDEQRISPLEVVEPQDDGPFLRSQTETFDDEAEHDLARFGRCCIADFGRVTEQVEDGLDEAVQRGFVGREAEAGGTDLSARPAYLVHGKRSVEIEPSEKCRGDRNPYVVLAVRSAGPGKDGHRSRREVLERPIDEATLADTRFAGDRHDGTLARSDHHHHRAHEFSLGGTANERRVVASARPGVAPLEADDVPHPFELLATTNLDVLDRFTQDGFRCQLCRHVADEDGSGRRQRLQACCEVDHIAHRCIRIGAGDRADDHFAGVDADSQFEFRAEIGLGVGELRDRRVHLHRGPNGPIRIVFVGDGGSEDGENTVAEDLVDPSAERGDVVLQPLEGAIDETLHTLGVQFLAERGVADDVGEDHRDDPALLCRRAEHLVPTERAEPCSFGERPRTGDAGHQHQVPTLGQTAPLGPEHSRHSTTESRSASFSAIFGFSCSGVSRTMCSF